MSIHQKYPASLLALLMVVVFGPEKDCLEELGTDIIIKQEINERDKQSKASEVDFIDIFRELAELQERSIRTVIEIAEGNPKISENTEEIQEFEIKIEALLKKNGTKNRLNSSR